MIWNQFASKRNGVSDQLTWANANNIDERITSKVIPPLISILFPKERIKRVTGSARKTTSSIDPLRSNRNPRVPIMFLPSSGNPYTGSRLFITIKVCCTTVIKTKAMENTVTYFIPFFLSPGWKLKSRLKILLSTRISAKAINNSTAWWIEISAKLSKGSIDW